MANQIPIVDYLVLDDGDPHLVANECTKCGAVFFDRRNACARCGEPEFDQEAPRHHRRGALASRSCTRPPPACRCPTCRRWSTSTAAASVKANVVNVEPDPQHVSLGMKVRLTTFVAGTDDDGTEAVAFGFEPV